MMIEINTLSYSFSLIILFIGITLFFISNFRLKYLNVSVTLSISTRLMYLISVELSNSECLEILAILGLLTFAFAILFLVLGEVLRNDSRMRKKNQNNI